MRYEVKYRLSKISANNSSNRHNICKSLAIKHQLELINLFLNCSLGKNIKLGPPQSLFNLDSIRQEIKIWTKTKSIDSILKYLWFNIKGTQYQPKTVLTFNICELKLLTFRLINDIFIYNNNKVIFKCIELHNIVLINIILLMR